MNIDYDTPKMCRHCDEDDCHCAACGEHIRHEPKSEDGYFQYDYREEVAEFVTTDGQHVIAHGECGFGNGWEMA